MKIAMRVTMFAVMLGAGAVASGNMGQPLPFPIPPDQIAQDGTLGQPLPFPIPPDQIAQDGTLGQPLPFPIPPANLERV